MIETGRGSATALPRRDERGRRNGRSPGGVAVRPEPGPVGGRAGRSRGVDGAPSSSRPSASSAELTTGTWTLVARADGRGTVDASGMHAVRAAHCHQRGPTTSSSASGRLRSIPDASSSSMPPIASCGRRQGVRQWDWHRHDRGHPGDLAQPDSALSRRAFRESVLANTLHDAARFAAGAFVSREAAASRDHAAKAVARGGATHRPCSHELKTRDVGTG